MFARVGASELFDDVPLQHLSVSNLVLNLGREGLLHLGHRRRRRQRSEVLGAGGLGEVHLLQVKSEGLAQGRRVRRR